MKCFKCGSHRMMKFIDGFSQKRIFCRGCWGSFLEIPSLSAEQKKLHEFDETYYNNRAIIKHF